MGLAHTAICNSVATGRAWTGAIQLQKMWTGARGGTTMPKGNRNIVYLVSTANTGYYYTTTKNRRAQQEKLKLKKYDPIVRKHVVFEEKNKL